MNMVIPNVKVIEVGLNILWETPNIAMDIYVRLNDKRSLLGRGPTALPHFLDDHCREYGAISKREAVCLHEM